MPTNTLQSNPSARHNAIEQLGYLRANIVFGGATGPFQYNAVNGVPIVIGTIPAGSLIMKATSGHQVITAFNAGTANTLDVGVGGGSGVTFSAAGSMTATAFVPVNAATGVFRVAVDTVITVTPNITGTAPTTGDVEVLITYAENI